MTAQWTVGDEIRKARHNAGLQQGELAQRIGVTRPTLSKWERGQGEPTVTIFRKIAYETKQWWLLREPLPILEQLELALTDCA